MNASFVTLLPYFVQYGYVALFVILYFSAAYLPFPANIALIGAGVLSRFGAGGVHFNILIASAVGLSGNVLGDLTGYYIARRFSNKSRQQRFEERHRSFRKMSRYLKEHPYFTIGITRLIGFVSPVINSIAGFTKYPFWTFFWCDLAGNTLYVLIYIGMGYIIGSATSNFTLLSEIVVGIALVVAALYGGVLYFLNTE